MMNMIEQENIRVQIDAAGWEDAIRRAGALLLEAGSITEKYIDAMVDAVHEFGPYMVITPGFALAHAAPCDAVLKNDTALVTLRTPVTFGCENDPVRVILCISCTDRESHRVSLKRIAKMMVDDGVLDRLVAAQSVDDITRLIAQY